MLNEFNRLLIIQTPSPILLALVKKEWFNSDIQYAVIDIMKQPKKELYTYYSKCCMCHRHDRYYVVNHRCCCEQCFYYMDITASRVKNTVIESVIIQFLLYDSVIGIRDITHYTFDYYIRLVLNT